MTKYEKLCKIYGDLSDFMDVEDLSEEHYNMLKDALETISEVGGELETMEEV